MEDWTTIEGAVWDALSSLAETGEAGTYRNQDYDYFEIHKLKLSEMTGMDFRLGWYRKVLEQLVELGLVVCRLTGDRRTAFYSLPEGMTHERFFRGKASGRYERANAIKTPVAEAQEVAVKAPEKHTQAIRPPAPVDALPEPLARAYGVLDSLVNDVARTQAIKDYFGLHADWVEPPRVNGFPVKTEVAQARRNCHKFWNDYQNWKLGVRDVSSTDLDDLLAGAK